MSSNESGVYASGGGANSNELTAFHGVSNVPARGRQSATPMIQRFNAIQYFPFLLSIGSCGLAMF